MSIPLSLVDGWTISWRSLDDQDDEDERQRETTRTRSEGSSRRVNPFELEIRIHRFVEGVEAEGHSKIKMSTGGRWSRGIRNQSVPDAQPFSTRGDLSLWRCCFRETISWAKLTRDAFNNRSGLLGNDKTSISSIVLLVLVLIVIPRIYFASYPIIIYYIIYYHSCFI